jgi:phosphate transport system permease protein
MNPSEHVKNKYEIEDTASKIKKARIQEFLVRNVLFVCAIFCIAVSLGIVVVLFEETLHFFREVSLLDFMFGTEWTPLFEPRKFGIWPLIMGTSLITLGAAVVGIPLGIGIAIFLNEYASQRVQEWFKPVLEILAGIPTVVYGYFAVKTITPALQSVIPQIEVFNALSAAIVVGIMIVPMIASLCDDAIRSVPRSVKEAGYALGATKLEVTSQVVIPAAMSGLVAAFILALSRALGETMAVTLAAGSTPKMSLNPMESVQTMTAYIVQVSLGDTPHGTLEYRSIFAVGSVLFLMTLAFNLLAYQLVKKYRRVYE